MENAVASLEVTGTVYRARYDRRDDDQPARDRCLSALVADAVAARVLALVIDTRGVDRDRRDRKAIADALAGRDRPTYVHRGSRDEPLLALPDALGWADGAGRDWRTIVERIIEVRDLGGEVG